MSRVCQICGRGTSASQKRSHSNIATKTKQYINIQSKKINGAKMKVCAKCIKTTAKDNK